MHNSPTTNCANDANSVYYDYDANDRLALTSLSVPSPVASAETYGYTTGTNRLASVVNGSGTRTQAMKAKRMSTTGSTSGR